MTPRQSPTPTFDHLRRLTDERGVFEHALLAVPRREHGYCTDDAARALVVVCREAGRDSGLDLLEQRYLSFVVAAVQADGTCHNRMDVAGQWQDEPGLGDWWGRAVWGLGVAATQGSTPAIRARALLTFRIAARQRSPHLHAMAYAALGAAEVLVADSMERTARDLLSAVVTSIGTTGGNRGWPWPEPRLRYANGTVAEALIAAGASLPARPALEHGLRLLDFLLKIETSDGHLSVTPVGGRGRGDVGRRFDQQPIEVAALADASAAAYRVTRDPHWLSGIRAAWDWFLGDNDSSTPMFDGSTGGGYDGLEALGPNLNQGAESTIALLSTAQHARAISELR